MKILGPPTRSGIPQLDRRLELGLIVAAFVVMTLCLLATAIAVAPP